MTNIHQQQRVSVPRRTGSETIRSIPNAVTLARTGGAVGIGAYAVSSHSLLLLGIAYGVYWVGDMADGWVARRLDQEAPNRGGPHLRADRRHPSLLAR